MTLLTPARLKLYPAVLLGCYLIVATAVIAQLVSQWPDLEGVPGVDFVIFYCAGDMAASGLAAEAYRPGKLPEHCLAAYPWMAGAFPSFAEVSASWFYPPIFFLPVHVLSQVHFVLALVLWLGLTGAFLARALRGLMTSTQAWLILATAPALWYTILGGQNAFLTAGLIALFYRQFWGNAVLAGLAIGLLCYKPHLGLVFPILLLAYRRCTSIAVAAATVIALTAASLLAYGTAPWQVFFTENLPIVTEKLTSGDFPLAKMGSGFVFARTLGAPAWAAEAIQILTMLVALGTLVALIRRGASFPLVFAFAVAIALPVSPHNFIYDWVMLIIPAMLLINTVGPQSLKGYEKAILALLWIVPGILLALPKDFPFAPGFPVLVAFAAMIVIRAWAADPREKARTS